ncbi:PIG-L family deacetylase [Antiquaquibacter oligotrophicus]|uniref:PIG-L deacetylase family protein n=1 Tax=Antiquaquibacter oligotrophicus TaxID=2880260 RepID=UPI002AC9EFD4|nr:PIG-L family deacetylase [Antiquaquibacter oligotrophicus]UDF12209.1 PIG-L family deacetylase [Antiquaquibacter oligotrophicus]
MSFDHRDPGTSEEEWTSSQHWASVPWADARDIDHVIVLAAHPDDETLGAGALTSRLHRAGTRVTVVLATRGEAAERGGDAIVRTAEFYEAASILAPGCDIVDLGLPDGRLGEHELDLEAALIGLARADLIVAPWRGDGHSDHTACGAVAALAAASSAAILLEYPVWMWHWASPDDADVPWDDLIRVPVSPIDRAAKRAALASYPSQTDAGDGVEPILHRGMLSHFEREWETFVRSPE